ncbi:3-oxoacyl-[acyl-carrier-protein] synthase III C-terminal domain-containing protein [Roseivirga sp. BDSF3-8]|uniref:3-oxoacyl-[acyl-carrier-protein] synthase III C-terminal domain-containing protein n=1 Tax=Roseivirga sp. BDSF3-8 TaxID=3241598 RepID=UPI0035321634
MKNAAYITAIGAYLPNGPIGNEEMEDYLGLIAGKKSRVKDKILKQNGIRTRHYALNKTQESTHTNAEMAALACREAMDKAGVRPAEVDLLATGTTQGDLPVPGFASMVHAELPLNSCEVASFQSVCASGMMALKHACLQVKGGEKHTALSVGSEFASRLFKHSRFEAQGLTSVPFDTEFLRWMLSDGAGAFVIQDRPARQGLSLRVDWIDLASHAHAYPACMYTGMRDNRNGSATWLDYPDYESASQQGALNLKQDIRLLDKVVQQGVSHYFNLMEKGMIVADEVDWLCCHYSSEFFKKPIQDLMSKGGGAIPEHKWFSNLQTKGNTGAASIYIMLEELLYSGKLKEGDRILCMVPESGRFITSFMQLRVMGTDRKRKAYAPRPVESPELVLKPSEINEKLVRDLARVWIDFETNLLQVPVIRMMHEGNMTPEWYKLLLHDLRQQVIDGSQWISRAASHIDIDLFDLRSAFIRHTATEHKDYQLLEKNFMALGQEADAIRTGRKNIGSEALSAYMFQRASRPNPVDLLGAMFIIEGIGKRLAGNWGRMMQEQLELTDEQVSFFTYHGVADENHFHHLEQAINTLWEMPGMNEERAQALAGEIVKTARTVARLYRMQLEELGNY